MMRHVLAVTIGVALCLCISSAQAETAYWTGALNNEWGLAGNWSTLAEPTVNTNVVFDTSHFSASFNPASSILIQGTAITDPNSVSSYSGNLNVGYAQSITLNVAGGLNFANDYGIVVVGHNSGIDPSAYGQVTISNAATYNLPFLAFTSFPITTGGEWSQYSYEIRNGHFDVAAGGTGIIQDMHTFDNFTTGSGYSIGCVNYYGPDSNYVQTGAGTIKRPDGYGGSPATWSLAGGKVEGAVSAGQLSGYGSVVATLTSDESWRTFTPSPTPNQIALELVCTGNGWGGYKVPDGTGPIQQNFILHGGAALWLTSNGTLADSVISSTEDPSKPTWPHGIYASDAPSNYPWYGHSKTVTIQGCTLIANVGSGPGEFRFQADVVLAKSSTTGANSKLQVDVKSATEHGKFSVIDLGLDDNYQPRGGGHISGLENADLNVVLHAGQSLKGLTYDVLTTTQGLIGTFHSVIVNGKATVTYSANAVTLSDMAVNGDANEDGRIDDNDLNALLSAWNSGTTWAQGNFKQAGTVDDNDLNTLLSNWTGSAGAAVPEPVTMALLALGGLGLLNRRK